MTVPGHPRTSRMLVRTKLSTLNFKPSEGTDDRLGHPRTSRMLVRTHLPATGAATPTSALSLSA